MGNVEKDEEKWEKEVRKLGKLRKIKEKLKRKEENEKCKVKND